MPEIIRRDPKENGAKTPQQSPPGQYFHSNIPMLFGNQTSLTRPRIDILLEKALQSPIVTVIAGAGYGKTHAVYSLVHKIDARTIWLQFSERDNIGERFWENFTAAVSTLSRESSVRLAEMGFPATERQFERYLEIPRHDVDPACKYIFVYDDLHLISDKMVLRFLEHSVTSSFPNISSILVSRSEPPFNLMKMVSKGQVTRITEEDLRFNREEMAAYFRLQNLNPSQQTLSFIYNDTEGWAFAIHLAALSLKNLPPTRGYVPQALRANIFRLIESEVMAPLEPALQRILVKLSLVDHLASNLLEELASKNPAADGGKGGVPLLEKMASVGSFIRFDPYLDAYHIHHLFLDYLKGRQNELSEEEKKDVWTRAAAWCVANGQNLDAISYYEKAHDYNMLVDVVYRAFPLSLPNRIARLLLEILERAPEETFRKIPAVRMLRFQIFSILELFDRAVTEIKKVIADLEAEEPSPAHYLTLSGCYNHLGFVGLTACTHTRDYDFTRWFEKGYEYYRLSGHSYSSSGPEVVAGLSAYVCRVSVPDKGEIEKYIEANAAMAFYVSRTMGGCFSGIDELARAEYAFFRADMAEAEQFALQALRRAQQANQYEIENRALYYLIRISIYNGNHEKIEDFLKLLKAQLSQENYLNRYTYHDIIMGWFYLQTGQSGKIASWLKNDFEESELSSLNYGLEVLVRAKYHYHEGRYHASMAAMTNQRGSYNSFGNLLFGKILFKFMEALCYYRLDNIKGAVGALEAAWELAAPNGLDLSFIEMGKDTRSMIGGILKGSCECAVPREWLERIHRLSSTYAKKVLMVMEKFRDGGGQGRRPLAGTGLSRRELEVLTGLSQGLTREEIAGASSISVNTVKSVVKSIYNKLGALNQADAVRIATERGLLKQDSG
ncbi:MAG: LuxR C-terminal-related transcriptional regulator [Treponema sp.]|jgi:LuxR family maltose regulon positive regulatory protein|nr:LuxR C-terminal-related transcriptional regulator [Treponema sp.]